MFFILICVAVFGSANIFASESLLTIKNLIDLACHDGNLREAYQYAISLQSQLVTNEGGVNPTLAGAYHARSELELIVNGDFEQALNFHKLGKAADPTVVPHLAKLHMDGHTCGGISDLFFVSAVIIKQVIDKATQKGINQYNPVLFDADMMQQIQDGFQTLITLTSDAGLHHEANSLVRRSISVLETRTSPHTESSRESFAALRFRAALLTPAIFESRRHLRTTRSDLLENLNTLVSVSHTEQGRLEKVDEFSLSPTFYIVYQGYHDRHLLEMLHASYGRANPSLSRNYLSAHDLSSREAAGVGGANSRRSLRIGFVSAHYRRHSICKLYCGIIAELANMPELIVYLFSALQENREDEVTRKLITALPHGSQQYVRIGKTVISNRNEVLNRNIDVLVYLDVGMDPATMIWAGARLALTQVCLWGHPTTTGMPHMDYFVSSYDYHVDNEKRVCANALLNNVASSSLAEAGSEQNATLVRGSPSDSSPVSTLAFERFTEQLVQFDSLGFHFERPSLNFPDANAATLQRMMSVRDDAFYAALLAGSATYKPTGLLRELIEERRADSIKTILCPQHLPKIHHALDSIFKGLLAGCKQCRLVLLVDGAKKGQWRRSLQNRWKFSIGSGLMKQIVWLDSLVPQAYLSLLAIGDLMLDPFPFGGGVTTLESLAVCTPVVTIPTEQTVPGLAAGQLRWLTRDELPSPFRDAVEMQLIAKSTSEYVVNSLHLLNHSASFVSPSLQWLRSGICERAHKLYSNSAAVEDWKDFLERLPSGRQN